MNRRTMLGVFATAILVAGISISLLAQSRTTTGEEAPPPTTKQPFEELLIQSVHGYEFWYRATDIYRWAPESCSAVVTVTIESTRLSEARDSSLHSRKLYKLYVWLDGVSKEAGSTSLLSGTALVRTYALGQNPIDPQPVGQVLVKESWTPVEVPFDQLPADGHCDRDGHAILRAEQKAYRAGEQHELFVMMKLDPATPETDNGWVYGVLTSDGTRALNSGRIESCMKCHLNAPHDRLFGLK